MMSNKVLVVVYLPAELDDTLHELARKKRWSFVRLVEMLIQVGMAHES